MFKARLLLAVQALFPCVYIIYVHVYNVVG